ncbi:hypothetical protein A2U01_0093078, partial [Trifolium medium]|nr:hypothetical protein [Trifolium medium]
MRDAQLPEDLPAITPCPAQRAIYYCA